MDLFIHIVQAVEAHNDYCKQRPNAIELSWYHSHKVVPYFCMIVYGLTIDSVNEISRIGESTIIQSFKAFVRVVTEVFGDQT